MFYVAFHLRNKLIFSNALLTRRGFHTNQILFKAKNYYEILNISRNASQKDIKKAYYQLAKKYHPDTNKNDPNTQRKFQEVSEAYEVCILSNYSFIYIGKLNNFTIICINFFFFKFTYSSFIISLI